MNPGTENATVCTKEAFARIARDVFSLDPEIRWVAFEQAGREPRWAWRDPATSRLYVGTTDPDPDGPLKFMLTEERDDLYGHQVGSGSHHLLFVVLAYADFLQVIARCGSDATISVAADPSADVYTLGMMLTTLLHRGVKEPLLQ